MWALRRASVPIRSRISNGGISRFCCASSETASRCLDERGVLSDPYPTSSVPSKKYSHSICISSAFSMWKHNFSSQAGARNSGEEDDSENGFSDLEMSAGADVAQGSNSENGSEDELISEPEFSEDDEDSVTLVEPSQNELELSDAEVEISEKKTEGKRIGSELFNIVIAAPGMYIAPALNKWVEDGKDLNKEEIMLAMQLLRRRRMYGRALQLSEWLEKSKKLEFVERDYGSRLDLIAKAQGLYKAEQYIEKIPKSFRGEFVYRTLLANYVAAGNVKKAEEVFNKMKDLEFPITCFACDQLLLLYKKVERRKLADVILLMEKENVKPSLLTYKILIDVKGRSNDINGMEQIVEAMKAEGIEPDLHTQSIIAKHYVAGGLPEKAEATLKEMEKDNINHKLHLVRRLLLPLYGALGKADEVKRLWKLCESSPWPNECIAAIEAWGKLKNVEEAEAVFDQMSKRWKPSSRHYTILLQVYAEHKKLAKGKDLLKRMGDSGCRIGPFTWDALVKLYVESGEVEKADSMLQKAAQQKQIRPMFNSYVLIMYQYAKRGDIHNSEKMFYRMKQSGYTPGVREFQILVQAYVNAKSPFYGFKERMIADKIFPNKALAGQLPLVDAFRKTAVSDLLD